MCRQAIGGSQSKDDLGDLDWVAGLVAPVRLQSLDDYADRRLIVREQVRSILVRPRTPVGPHATGLERTHLDAKGSHFLCEGLGESSHRPFGGVIRRIAGPGEAASNR